jgi:KilA-N domain
MTIENKQLPLPLIQRKHANTLITQRAKDGYINATAMCKAANRPWSRYWDVKASKDFADALSSDLGIPISELIQSVSGGIPEMQGTWVHPQVAIHLAQWLSPQFAVQVTTWVFEWISGGPKIVERLPYHLRRYVANMTAIPATHFSMLQELTYGLIAPMEAQGYTLPEYMVPDISEGKMFSRWLREEKEIEPSTFPTYEHRYEDGRVISARLYPNSLLADFRAHFHDVWLPTRCESYFAGRDPNALPYLLTLLPARKKLEAITQT